MIDMVVPRHSLKESLARVIDLLMRKSPGAEIVSLKPESEETAEAGNDDGAAPPSD